jgi:phosphomethylpyrimidine synthase
VRISKEIVQFASGKDEKYQWDQARVSAALTETQQTILQQRGVLEPSEIHKLATKTRKTMGAEDNKAGCHSDVTDAEAAQQLQHQKLAPPDP